VGVLADAPSTKKKDMKTESKTTFEALSRDFGIELKFMM
jgi:hypothetical protein